jgi:hypothetical protein
MPDTKLKLETPRTVSADDEHEVDNVVRHYGLTREQARQLIRQFGGNRRELEAAAGRITAKRVF